MQLLKLIVMSFLFSKDITALTADELKISNAKMAISRTKPLNMINNTEIGSFIKNLGKEITDVPYSDFRTLAHQYNIKNFEEYDVVTEDNYILKIFHIPGVVSKPVLIAHGIFSSSDDFLLRGNTSLIHFLIHESFDVWLINFRGNRYSRRHHILNPDTDADFWDYSLDELGRYDLPAVIDFVLNKTKQKQLSYVGHSQGTTSFFIMASTKPSYNDKIKVFIGLAPAAFLSDPGPIFSAALPLYPPVIRTLAIALNINEVIGFDTVLKHILNVVCSQGKLGYDICVKKLIDSLSGHDDKNLEMDFLHKLLQHFPAGASRKSVDHYVQLSLTNKFANYDYGTNNYAIYRSIVPPEYNIQNVKCKVALFGAHNDQIVGVKETERIKNALPNVVNFTIVSDPEFTHQDHVWSKNAYKVLYPHVIDILNRYIV